MRLPGSWQDQGLLDDEPFLTQFHLRKISTKRLGQMYWVDTITGLLREEDGGLQAAQAWIDLTFSESESDGTPRPKPGVAVHDNGLNIFVQVFWLIYEGKEKDASRLLNKERLKMGFKYAFDATYVELPQKVTTARENVPIDALEGDLHQTGRNIERSCSSTNVEPNHNNGKPSDATPQNRTKKQRTTRLSGRTQPPHRPRPTKKLKKRMSSTEDKSGSSSWEPGMVDNRVRTTKKTKLATEHRPTYDGVDGLRSQPNPRAIGAANFPRMVEPEERVKSHTRQMTKRVELSAEQSSTPVSEIPWPSEQPFPSNSEALKRGRTPRAISSRPAKRSRLDGGPASVGGHLSRVMMATQTRTKNLVHNSAGKELTPAVEGPSTTMDTHVDKHPWTNSLPDIGGLRQLSTVADVSAVENVQIDQRRLSESGAPPAMGIISNAFQTSFTEPLEHWDKEFQPNALGSSVGPGMTHKSPYGAHEAPEERERRHGNLADFSVEMQDPIDGDEYMKSEVERPPTTDPRQQNKLPLPKLPPIWAQSRQELCESFDWFRSYQSGVYYGNNVVKGYLLSAFSSSRDIFHHEGKLIISHGGGKAESLHTQQGQTETRLATDQLAQDKSVRALLTNYRNRRPLVLLIDDKYAPFKYDLVSAGVTYTVLGFYLIAHAWAEYQPAQNDSGQVIRYKFAFQWCEDQGEPWWTSMDNHSTGTLDNKVSIGLMCSSPTPSPHLRDTPNKVEILPFSELRPSKPGQIYFQCGQCLETSPRVYRQSGWMCLNASCSKFWKQSNGNAPVSQLDYTDKFLEPLPTPRLPPECRELQPPPPADGSSTDVTTDYEFSKGWHCKKCGRLSSRFKWQHWECSYCQATFGIRGRLREAREFWGQLKKYNWQDHVLAPKSDIRREKVGIKMFANGTITCQTFILPLGGLIHHIRADPRANMEADIIFKEYQEQAVDGRLAFRRWPLRTHKCRGSLLTNYFSQNTGEPYQYVGGSANTVPFSAAPSAVVKARNLIEDRVFKLIGRKVEFNEVLSAAYMERQKMAFHSDNEKGLGPIVAGLSLGSAALMHFRRHAQFVPTGQPRKVDVTFILRHGDVLVMDGESVQRCYEHTVIPVDFRIAATARFITPSS